MSLVSNVIPRKVKQYEGPETFSRARGILNIEHVFMIAVRFLALVVDCWEPMVRKSSR